MGPCLVTDGGEKRFGRAWLFLAVTFALHVADEAGHDFLTWWNPIALSLRSHLAGLPFPPTFQFNVWLSGLILLAIVCFALTPLAYARRAWLRPIAYIWGGIHAANGVAHIAVSLHAGRALPGVLSAPLLLGSALWLMWETRHSRSIFA
jgi:hypothetical protein